MVLAERELISLNDWGPVKVICAPEGWMIVEIHPRSINDEQRRMEISGNGEVFSLATIYDPPAGYEHNAPYTIALVRLKEGPLILTQLTDVGNEEICLGMPVEMVIRKLRVDGEGGLIQYGYKFRPVMQRVND